MNKTPPVPNAEVKEQLKRDAEYYEELGTPKERRVGAYLRMLLEWFERNK
jgi:hypothetical protein